MTNTVTVNANSSRTVLAILTAVIGIGQAYFGCENDGVTTCSVDGYSEEAVGGIVAMLGLLHLALKLYKDGWRGLYRPMVIITPTGERGTVTQAQVDRVGSRDLTK